MVTEVLYQILLVVGIVVGILLIVNLWRLADILKRIQSASKIIENRVIELDAQIAHIQTKVADIPNLLKNFFLSFEVVRMVMNRFGAQSNESEKEGENNERK